MRADHLMDVVTLWWPVYPLSAAFKVVCAAVSVPTALYLARTTPALTEGVRTLVSGLANAEREKEDVEANYRGQIEAINRSQMVIEFTMEGTILKANEMYLNVFGYTAEELQGKGHSIFVTEEYRESPEYKDFWDELRAGQSQYGEFKRIGKNGEEVWIAASYNPISGTDQIPRKVVKVATDVTGRVPSQRSSSSIWMASRT
jgi:PAS domain S-box-containing protein